MAQNLKRLPRSIDMMLRKNIVMYGASNSGKSVMTVDILHTLKSVVPNIVVFAPTADSNGAYEGIVPDKMIKRTCTIKQVESVYKRQVQAASAYKTANSLEVLSSVFNRIARGTDRQSEAAVLELSKTMLVRVKSSNITLGERNKQKKTIETMRDEYLRNIYKQRIRQSVSTLGQIKLTAVEQQSVQFIDFNPNLVIVFDDCSSVFTRKFQKSQVMLDLFYQGRHSFITTIFGLHDDTGLESYLRKNAALSLFMTAECAVHYFTNSSNSFTATMKTDALQKIDAIFDSDSGVVPAFSKLVYVRNDETPLRYALADIHEVFKFGSAALWELCDRIEKIQRATKSLSSTFGRYS